jgi:ATP-dependent RNA helicase DeaD
MAALDVSLEDLAAALALMARSGARASSDDRALAEVAEPGPDAHAAPPANRSSGRPSRGDTGPRERRSENLVGYRIEVGAGHGAKPGNIVGAIANEAGLAAGQIGRINIRQDFSIVELPADLAPETLEHLGQVRVAGRPLRIRPDTGAPRRPEPRSGEPERKRTRDRRQGEAPSRPDQRSRTGPGRPARTRAERKARFKSGKKR